jgi:aspartate/methionine/tyrosine aminotransferase
MLSSRSEEYLNYEIAYLGKYYQKAYKNEYSETNPKGYINLAVAENILSTKKLFSKIKLDDEIPIEISRYGDITGGDDFKIVLSKFLESAFFQKKIDIKNMFITNGCGPTIDLLSHLLLDANDIVLIPEPFYSALNVDFGRSKVSIAGLKEDGTLTPFKEALSKHGKKVKCVFITNPNNPTGTIYSPEYLELIFKWCDENDIHVIVDEIYALSVFKKDSFVSSSSFYGKISEKFDSMLHILWGVSKDFGISGFRLSMLYTENQKMVRNMMPIFLCYCTSSFLRHALKKVFSDESFLLEYVESNQVKLYNQYLVMEEFLIKNEIEFVKSQAAFFIWINLTKYLKHFNVDEEKLWEMILDETKVNICCGKYFHTNFKPKQEGWFRICFPCVEKEVLLIALGRLEKFFQIKN